jgi:transposase
MRGRWELSDAQWQLIEPILRPRRRAEGRGRRWQDTRTVLNGILWVLGTGAQWGELPKNYPAYQTCYCRQQSVREGKQERILRAGGGVASARKTAAGGGLYRGLLHRAKNLAVGPTKGDKGTKIIALADDHSLPLADSIESASPHEVSFVEGLIGHSFLYRLRTRLIGDKAYDSDRLDPDLAKRYGIEMIAPHR